MSMSHSATAGRPKGETTKAITSPCMPQRSPVNKANRAPIRQRKDRAQNTHDAKEKAKFNTATRSVRARTKGAAKSFRMIRIA